MIVTCGDIECKYYSPRMYLSVDHRTDRFYITRGAPRDDIKPNMQASEPSG